MKKIRVALVGQPNVGKSMLVNSISNTKLHVGNFTGVTVEKKEVKFDYENVRFHITDLPGTYSLNDYSPDEKVTREFLLSDEYDIILNVLDATSLQRNLALTTELLELNSKMVVALNMMDEASKEGIEIDDKQLGAILGLPVVPVSAKTKYGIEKLLMRLVDTAKFPTVKPKLIYSEAVEEEIEQINEFLIQKNYLNKTCYRDIAIKLLKRDKALYKSMHDNPIWLELQPILRKSLKHLYLHYSSEDIDEIFIEEREAFSKGAVTEVIEHKREHKRSTTERIDSLLIHPILGIPIFLFFMWGLFQLTFELGTVPMDFIDAVFGAFGEAVGASISHDGVRSLIVDGIVAGVGAVVLFLPNIVILFFGIALLESTGYMARVSFLLDEFFHKFGLHGKSFVPLVTGFGCSVPAYMAARTIKNRTDRMVTLFIIGFMSCGAKLPVYVLFVGAFFSQEQAGNILFLIYIIGAIFGLIAAKILRITAFKGESEPFVMEMPKYRLPSLKLLWHTVYTKALMYLKKAGTFILAASMIVWFASNFPKHIDLEEFYATKINATQSAELKEELGRELSTKMLELSYLGIAGKTIEPLFEPLGFDWRMTVALQTGLAAKEVIVSTMGVLYALGDEVTEEDEGLVGKIREHIPFASAISFMVFIMIYLPCLAASMVFMREAGGAKYLGYLFVLTTLTAYLMSFIAYRVALFF